MQTNVYANDREICSKAADGVSTAAFPDVCWSPPGPPAGPVPIPYPNTAYARDLTNATKTVFICGTEVAQKDKSYLSTSTGDEAATYAFQKGLNTGALKGKAYFTSWSMNVKAEGLNVARHQDMTTHNHASPGGNTPPQLYFDDPSGRAKRACDDELKRVEKACKPDDDDGDPNTRELRKIRKGFVRKLADKFKAAADKVKAKGFKPGGKNAWMEDHCGGLWIKPSTRYMDDVKKFAAEIGNISGELGEIVKSVAGPLAEKLGKELLEKLGKEAAERGIKLGARATARWAGGAAGGVLGPVGAAVTEVGATLWNIYDWGSTAWDGYQLSKEAYGLISQIDDIMGSFNTAMNGLNEAYKQALTNPQAAMASAMGALSRFNACTRARRCILVKYKNTFTLSSLDGDGCCPGQTGHHVMPDEMTKGGPCPGYNKYEAPTVCVEGVNNSHGTHGAVHRRLAKIMNDYKNRFTIFGSTETMDYATARDASIESVRDTFPESACSKDCLRAQLDAYYNCTGDLPAKAGTNDKGTELDEDPGATK